jgi:hypothetical protein
VAADDTHELKGQRIFRGTHCRLLAFEIEFKKNDLRADDLWKAMGLSSPPISRIRNTCGSRSKTTDYHLHLTWTPASSCIEMTVEFAPHYRAPAPKEAEPFAEDFFDWLSEFVVEQEMSVDFYSDFDFPPESGRKIMFLPLMAKVGDVDAEIDGISFRLVPSRSGVDKLWTTQSEKGLTIHLHGSKNIVFSAFDAHREIVELTKTLDVVFQAPKTNQERGTK